jgi:hypothetical protein
MSMPVVAVAAGQGSKAPVKHFTRYIASQPRLHRDYQPDSLAMTLIVLLNPVSLLSIGIWRLQYGFLYLVLLSPKSSSSPRHFIFSITKAANIS